MVMEGGFEQNVVMSEEHLSVKAMLFKRGVVEMLQD